MKKGIAGLLLCTSLLQADECSDYYIQWIGLGHREGKGVGFKQGYTTFSTFLVAQKDFLVFCPLVDLRVHVFNQGRTAGNFGIGGRTFIPSCDAIAGLNLFYDFRKTDHRMGHQIGAGMEWLGVDWDFFANAYVPVGPLKSHFYGKRKVVSSSEAFYTFAGHELLLEPVRTDMFKKRQFEFGGFDVFARRLLLDNGTTCISAELGPYFYFGEYKKDIYGASFRMSANVLDSFTLTGEINYDSLFRTTMNVQLTFQIPFGSGPQERRNPCSSSAILQSKLGRKVDRREIIPIKFEQTHRVHIDPSVVATALDGNPFHFVFVNNQSAHSGDGSFERPFHALEAAQQGSGPEDILYVFQGNGTTSGMDAGFVFQDFQQMYGSGLPFTLAAEQGLIAVPALSQALPTITNRGGNALTLANRNLVYGMHILDPLAHGIYGSGIADTTLVNNRIDISGEGSGILLSNAEGILTVQENRIGSTYTTPNPEHVGIYYTSNAPHSVELQIKGNAVDHFYTSIRASAEKMEMLYAQVENNCLMQPDSIGIDLSRFIRSFGEVQVASNTIHSSGQWGIAVQSGEESFREGVLSDNTVTHSALEGITLATSQGGIFVASLQNNILEGNGGIAGFLANTSATGADTLCLTLNNNLSSNGFLLRNPADSESTFYLESHEENSGSLLLENGITEVTPGFCSE